MKHLRIGQRRAELVDAPDPVAQDDWVVIKIHAAPLCTEYKAFIADRMAESVGHEGTGEVVEVARPGPLRVGDRVLVSPLAGCGVCRLCRQGDYIHCQAGLRSTGHLAQYVAKPAFICPTLPDDIDYVRASLAGCALGPALNAAKRMDLGPFDTYMITGAGPVGMGALVVAKFHGATAIVVESIPLRQQKAREIGADHVLDPNDPDVLDQIMAITGGRGVDKAVDCSGNPQAHRLMIDAVARRGQVAFVGESDEPVAIRPSSDLIRKGVTLHGCWHYNLSHVPDMMHLIRTSPVVDQLISHVLPMTRAQEALEQGAAYETIKVILKPWE